MATTTKVENYTAEQAAELVSLYNAGNGLGKNELAERFGKSVRSIVAKLSRSGVYVKPERTTKTGAPIVKKDSLADQLAEIVGLSETETESLTKANKTALAKLLVSLQG